jgi:hypothetical protein
MKQYYVLTLDLLAKEVFAFIQQHDLPCETHLNRTRFWIPADGPLHTEFLLRFSGSCPLVDPDLDLATGR